MIRILGRLLISGLLLSACGPGDVSQGGGLDLRFARQAIDGPCPESVADDPAPPTLDKLEVVLYMPDGEQHYKKTIKLAGTAPARVGGIPAGEDLSLTVTGYVGDSAQWSGAAEGITIMKGLSTYADVFMTFIADMSCTARPLHRPRALLAAAAAGDGRVVLAGGVERRFPCLDENGDEVPGCTEMIASPAVDLFDPGTGVIYTARRLNTPRALATATPLASGGVLVVGGVSRLRSVEGSGMPFAVDEQDLVPTFEVYLPHEDIWIEKPLPGREGRVFHTATVFADGRVLVVGGGTGLSLENARDDALLFDPAGESVGDFHVLSDKLASPRLGHAAVLVGEKVIVIGGAVIPSRSAVEEFTLSGDDGVFTEATVTGPSPSLNLFFHDAILLPLRPDEILVAGGSFYDGVSRLELPSENNVRIYSVSRSESSDAGSMAVPRLLHRLAALDSDQVLLAGGCSDLDLTPDDTVETFDPSGSFGAPVTALSVPRCGHAVLATEGGRALLVGGMGPEGLLGSGEIFTPEPKE